MIGLVGAGSQICVEFARIAGEPTCRIDYNLPPPRACDKLLVTCGFLAGTDIDSITLKDQAKTWAVNYCNIVRYLDAWFTDHPKGRAVVIGSESGFSGSYDMAYAGAKAALHLYVETKKLQPGQQLVAIAPGIITDAGMTNRRRDVMRVIERSRNHPKKRHLMSREVAELAKFLLGTWGDYISGTVIRMNGGERR